MNIKNWEKCTSLLLTLVMCLGMAACGGNADEDFRESEPVKESDGDDGEITLEDLEGFWYPAGGSASTISVLTCIYIDGVSGTWQEYDQYGDPTEYTGAAYTDGKILTLADVSFIWYTEDVEIPIGDADTLVDETGENYWIKGEPDFKEKLGLLDISGSWYYKGDHTSEYRTVLTLNEDGTYTKGNTEEGTYTFEEVKVSATDADTKEPLNKSSSKKTSFLGKKLEYMGFFRKNNLKSEVF